MWTFTAQDESDTQRLGRALAGTLPAGAVIGLEGTLGAGKTRLVQALAAASGVSAGVVASPTFVLINEYAGDRPIYHFDTYRLKDDDEFLALGPEEYFAGDGVTLVEWADRVADCLPPERLTIRIAVTGPDQRHFTLVAAGQQYERVIAKVSQVLDSQTK
jgi:tRNA threonylcarbamoyladenosine biosynthesis protein TsaE